MEERKYEEKKKSITIYARERKEEIRENEEMRK